MGFDRMASHKGTNRWLVADERDMNGVMELHILGLALAWRRILRHRSCYNEILDIDFVYTWHLNLGDSPYMYWFSLNAIIQH